MARRKNLRNRRNPSLRRALSEGWLSPLDFPEEYSLMQRDARVIASQKLLHVIDYRRFKPTRLVIPRTVRARVASVRPRVFRNLMVSFNLPRQAIVCVRRKIRRQVLFAYGRGNGGARKHFNDRSFLKCSK